MPQPASPLTVRQTKNADTWEASYTDPGGLWNVMVMEAPDAETAHRWIKQAMAEEIEAGLARHGAYVKSYKAAQGKPWWKFWA